MLLFLYYYYKSILPSYIMYILPILSIIINIYILPILLINYIIYTLYHIYPENRLVSEPCIGC